jgi:putative ABC transport system substrate-binding protein
VGTGGKLEFDAYRRRWLSRIVLAWPAALLAQAPPKSRIGILGLESRASILSGELERFLATLAALGHVVGRNLEVLERYAHDPDELLRFAADLAAGRFDVIVTEGTPTTLALQNASRSIPIVTSVSDPVGAGFARSLRTPGATSPGYRRAAPRVAGRSSSCCACCARVRASSPWRSRSRFRGPRS